MKKRVLSIINDILFYAIIVGCIIFFISSPLNFYPPFILLLVFFSLIVIKKVFKLSEFEFLLLLINFYLGFLGENFMFGLYFKYQWYDKVLHFISWALIATVVYFRLSKIMPKKYKTERHLITFFSVLGLEALWEIIEYIVDNLFLGPASKNLMQGVYINGVMVMNSFSDTMYDIIFTALGILFALVVFFVYEESKKVK